MLIAQITDLHIGFEPDNPDEPNAQRLRAVLDHLAKGPDRPDLLLLSGDLTENGDAASYERLAGLLEGCPFPFRLMAGNHDERAALLAEFPATPAQGGFIHYVEDLGGVRLVALDTIEPGRHGGAFCAARAEWLAEVLDADSGTPVVIAMHHPPLPLGIEWMDPAPDEPWIRRLAAVLAGRPQVKAILTGHVHRPITSVWLGIPLTVCPSSAPAVALDLRPIDPDQPDGRKMVTGEPPAYALHRWDGERLISHVQPVASEGEWPVIVPYNATMQQSVRTTFEERSA